MDYAHRGYVGYPADAAPGQVLARAPVVADLANGQPHQGDHVTGCQFCPMDSAFVLPQYSLSSSCTTESPSVAAVWKQKPPMNHLPVVIWGRGGCAIQIGSRCFYGPKGTRTLDLFNAIEALSQLSYRPLIGEHSSRFILSCQYYTEYSAF